MFATRRQPHLVTASASLLAFILLSGCDFGPGMTVISTSESAPFACNGGKCVNYDMTFKLLAFDGDLVGLTGLHVEGQDIVGHHYFKWAFPVTCWGKPYAAPENGETGPIHFAFRYDASIGTHRLNYDCEGVKKTEVAQGTGFYYNPDGVTSVQIALDGEMENNVPYSVAEWFETKPE